MNCGCGSASPQQSNTKQHSENQSVKTADIDSLAIKYKNSGNIKD